MSYSCSNCDSHVSASYVRVFSRDGETVEVCPNCEDKTRESVDTETVSPGNKELDDQGDPDWLQAMLSPDEGKQTTEDRTQNSALVW